MDKQWEDGLEMRGLGREGELDMKVSYKKCRNI
jgi:hypothetical protein